MSRRPAPNYGEALDAAEAIVERHTKLDGPDLGKLSDSLDGVVAYVSRHGDPAPKELARLHDPTPAGVVRQDVVAALLVLDYLEHEHKIRLARARLGVILAGERAGMTNRDLMEPLHQKHTQGVPQMVGRLRALLDPEVGVADARRGRRAADARKDERAQVADRATLIIAFGRGLLARRHLVPDTPIESDLPIDFAYMLMMVERQLPGGEYESLDGLTASLRLLARYLTDFPGIDPELHAVLVHGAQALPPPPAAS